MKTNNHAAGLPVSPGDAHHAAWRLAVRADPLDPALTLVLQVSLSMQSDGFSAFSDHGF